MRYSKLGSINSICAICCEQYFAGILIGLAEVDVLCMLKEILFAARFLLIPLYII